VEPEGSLQHSQEPATYFYPETGQYVPHPPNQCVLRSILIRVLTPHLCLGLTSGQR